MLHVHHMPLLLLLLVARIGTAQTTDSLAVLTGSNWLLPHGYTFGSDTVRLLPVGRKYDWLQAVENTEHIPSGEWISFNQAGGLAGYRFIIFCPVGESWNRITVFRQENARVYVQLQRMRWGREKPVYDKRIIYEILQWLPEEIRLKKAPLPHPQKNKRKPLVSIPSNNKTEK